MLLVVYEDKQLLLLSWCVAIQSILFVV